MVMEIGSHLQHRTGQHTDTCIFWPAICFDMILVRRELAGVPLAQIIEPGEVQQAGRNPRQLRRGLLQAWWQWAAGVRLCMLL